MIRKAFRMSVYTDQYLPYENRHNPIWKELEDVLKAQGVHNYSIFLDPNDGSLFGYVEIEDETRYQAIAKTEVCQRWWKFMSDIMPSNTDHSPKSVPLKAVFHLD